MYGQFRAPTCTSIRHKERSILRRAGTLPSTAYDVARHPTNFQSYTLRSRKQDPTIRGAKSTGRRVYPGLVLNSSSSSAAVLPVGRPMMPSCLSRKAVSLTHSPPQSPSPAPIHHLYILISLGVRRLFRDMSGRRQEMFPRLDTPALRGHQCHESQERRM